MKQQKVILLGAVLLLSTPSWAYKAPAASWEDFPYIRTGTTVVSHGSVDPKGNTYNDHESWTMQDTAGYELLNVKDKPGMLVHAWGTSGEAITGNLKLYLSGSTTPDYNRLWNDYFDAAQNVWPSPKPLWGTVAGVQNPFWGFPCLPYDSSFSAKLTSVPNWYQLTVHQYREPRFSEAMSQSDVVAFNEILKKAPGAFPGKDSGDTRDTGTFSQPTGPTAIFDHKNDGVIRIIRMIPSDTTPATLDSIWITIILAGNDTAAHLPLLSFFGGYHGASITLLKGLPIGYGNNNLFMYFPMPFWGECKIVLDNHSGKSETIRFEIRSSSTNSYSQATTGTFRIKFSQGISGKVNAHFQHLNVQGSGMLVGVATTIADVEGNFRSFVDGRKSPSTESTGGEDYFCQAFNLKPYLQTQFMGSYNSTMVGYRFHIVDYYPFLSGMIFDQEVASNLTNDQSTVYYYWNPTSFIQATDSLNVGTVASETAHSYTIIGSRNRLQLDTASYDGGYAPWGNSNLSQQVDAGRWTNGQSSFTAQIAADNDGVRIRKRINLRNFHQTVAVYVDNQFAGTWFEQGGNYDGLLSPSSSWSAITNKFHDADFDIPLSFTKSKTSIQLKFVTLSATAVLDSADNGLTNEYYYWIYCYKAALPTSVEPRGIVSLGNHAARSIIAVRDMKLCIGATTTENSIVTVLDMAGHVLVSCTRVGANAVIDLKERLPSGLYVARVSSETGTVFGSGVVMIRR